MNGKKIYAIAKKEFLDNFRNKWIIAITIIFLILTLLISYAGTVGSTGWTDMEGTIAGMIALVQYLIPIIALMLGYATIVGEREKGSLSLMLSYPVQRWEVILGKFFGLATVLSMAMVIGFGAAGVIIGLKVSNVQWSEFLLFIAVSILLGLVYISLAILFSSIFKKRSTSLGSSIFIWFLFVMIWNLILVALLVAVAGYGIDDLSNADLVLPSWYYVSALVNPITAFSLMVTLNITAFSAEMTGHIPSFYTTPAALTILLLWILIPLFITCLKFNKKDL